ISLRASNSTRALGWTLASALFVGGGYLFCCVPTALVGSGGSDEMILSLCVPVLLSVPSLLALAMDPPDQLLGTYIMGVFLYALAALVIFASILNNFDAWNGRNDGNTQTPPTPKG